MFEFYLKGGLLMHPIFFVSVIALTISLERLWYFAALGRRNAQQKFADIENAIRKGNLGKAKKLANAVSGPIGEILRQGLGESQHTLAQEGMMVSGEKIVKDAARGLALLALLPSLSTLLGLLGTVIGLMLAFKKVAFLKGSVSPALLASGIWVALITTAAGLIVAIPSLIAHHFFQNAVSKLQFEMEHYGSRLLLLLKTPSPETNTETGLPQNPSVEGHLAPQDLEILLSKGEP